VTSLTAQSPASGRGYGTSRAFLRTWCACSLSAAAAATALDAVLLQRTEGYFTGGFLSTEHLRGGWEAAGFVAVSILVDFAVGGVLAGLVLWGCHRLRRRAWIAAGVLAGFAPLAFANVLSHELVRYFGDLVDVSLLFELTGRSVPEMLAASAGHLMMPVFGASSVFAACAGLVWLIDRGGDGRPAGRPSAIWLGVPVLALLAALGVATAANAANERIENGVSRKPSGRALVVMADTLSDFDGDGFGMAGRLRDPQPFDTSVFPYALDVPGNGIDEDGAGGDFRAGADPYVEAPPYGSWSRRPDVVLVVLESFRFDLLGAAYDGRPVTPVLDALSARGISSQHAYSHNGYTAQSRFHLLSGSLAGVRGPTTLIDDFRTNGYFVAYVSGQDESFGGPRYDSGFSRADVAVDARSDRDRRYTTFTTAGSLAVPFHVVEERVSESLERVPADRPLFLYVNFHDTHFPYSHDHVEPLTADVRLPRHRIVPGERDAVWASYVNTAANVDRAVGRVLDAVRRARGVEPAIVVTADHGESLFENGFLGHGHALDDVQTRVPFIVTNLPLTIEEPFGHSDLRDAIGNALAGANPPPQARTLAGGEVFQYLGTINRPRQIALRDSAGLVVYDFRTRQLQIRGGQWQAAERATGSDHADLVRLVEYWERMMLARAQVQGG
jgi:hypothetical protein